MRLQINVKQMTKTYTNCTGRLESFDQEQEKSNLSIILTDTEMLRQEKRSTMIKNSTHTRQRSLNMPNQDIIGLWNHLQLLLVRETKFFYIALIEN